MSEIEQRMAATDNAMGELYEAATVYMDAGEAGELLAHRDFHDAKLAAERAAWRAEVERLREQVRRLADHAEAFAETVEHAERCRDARGQGGQQVPYHGDFASVTPSVAGRLAWWARQARAVLATLPREEGT